MNKHRVSIVIVTVVLLALANLKGLNAQAQDAMSTFFQKDYAGLSIRVDATQEMVPAENMAIRLSVTCTAIGVKVENLNFAVYGFEDGREKIQLNTFEVIRDSSLTFNSTYESRYDVFVPSEVWGPIYAELQLKYAIVNSKFADEPSFAMTTVRNVYYEQLQENLKKLNESYNQLNSTYWQLKSLYAQLNASYDELNSRFAAKSADYEQLQQNFNKLSESYNQLESSYGKLEDLYAQLNARYDELNQNYTGLNQNYTQLNQNYTKLNQNYTELNSTYTELGQNCTSLQGSLDDASGTRQVTLILGVMTALFVGTTVFLLIRKPKQYGW